MKNKRAADALLRAADKHYFRLRKQQEKEVGIMNLIAWHIENRNVRAARAIVQNHKHWMDIPSSTWDYLYPPKRYDNTCAWR